MGLEPAWQPMAPGVFRLIKPGTEPIAADRGLLRESALGRKAVEGELMLEWQPLRRDRATAMR